MSAARHSTGGNAPADSASVKLNLKGCDMAQGYLFSQPAPADELSEWLRERFRQDQLKRAPMPS